MSMLFTPPVSQTHKADPPMVVRVSQPWNANLHYDKVLLALTAPTGGQRVLDVGCGDGFLSAALVERGHRVTGLDADAPVLARARERWGAASVDWVHADLMTADLAPASFDAVVSNATLHHLPDTRAALRQFFGVDAETIAHAARQLLA